MKINSITKKSLLLISLAMVSTTYQTQAAPIEDRKSVGRERVC